MAKKKPSQRSLAIARAEYLTKREQLLRRKVDRLQIRLFDMVFEQYLMAMEQQDGRLVKSNQNIDMIKNLDRIYNLFKTQENLPVVKDFLGDMNEVHNLNVRYFSNISREGVRASKANVKATMDKMLGLDDKGQIIKGGFADKFLRDESSLKKIKRLTNKALTRGEDFQTFRKNLKEFIVGGEERSGVLQQYYRNYAYDTYQKVDRINGIAFGKSLGLRYFIYQGGLIDTSRPFCRHYNGRIVDSLEFARLRKEDLPEDQQNGLPDKWEPMKDLGGYGCRHSIDWITEDVALRNRDKFNQRADGRSE